MHRRTFILTTLLMLNASLSLGIVHFSNSESELLPTRFTKAIESINMTEIQEHVRYLSGLGSRVSGYEGNTIASEYIAGKLSEYRIEPYGADGEYFEYFNITIPIDLGASVTLEDGTKLDAYMFWPNLVNPSPYQSPAAGDKLVYIRGGDLSEYEKVDVNGKFVLMDFDSRWLFRMAMTHGAKGAIFVPDDESLTDRADAEQKILFVPMPFPRLYLPSGYGRRLIQICEQKGEIKVFVSANMTYEVKTVRNVVGYIEGKDPDLAREAIVISAYYDSWSVVPKLSPGATDALGVSVLLNLAKFLAENPPDRSVILLATTGHWQFAWGAREYIERHFDEIGTKIVMFVSLDLASDSESLGVYARGASFPFTMPQVMNPRYSWLVTKLFQDYLTQIRLTIGNQGYGSSFIDGILLTHPAYVQSVPPYDPAASTIYGGIPTSYAAWWRSFGLTFDADPFVSACYGSGFTFHTSNAFRRYQRTPYDIHDNLEFENVYTQAIFMFSSLWGLSNEPKISLYLNPSRVRDDWGYCTLTVVPSEYNMKTAYWDPMNSTRRPELWDDIIVRVSTLAVGITGGGAAAGIPTGGAAGGAVGGLIGGGIAVGGLDIITKIDKEGKAVIHGLKPYVPAFVDVFVVNRTNGRIEWSTDIGVFQAPGGKAIAMSTSEQTKIISMFPCASVAIVSAYNPVDFRFVPGGGILVYNARSHGPMIRQNSLQFDTDFIAFVSPEVETEILLSMGERFPIAVLNNASRETPAGSGYILRKGEMIVLSPSQIAANLYHITSRRYDTLYSHQTYTPAMQLYQRLASEDLSSLYHMGEVGRFGAEYGYSYSLWASTLTTYSSVMDLVWQVLATLSFFFLISIVATLTLERLLLSYEGLKRLLSTIILFAITQTMLGILHPGYTIATNAFVSLLSVGMLFIVLPLIAFIMNEVLRSAGELRRKMVGIHFAEISRSGMIAHSYSVGLRAMKKRRLRTIFTTASLTIIIGSMVTFASVTISPVLMKEGLSVEPRYEGLLIRRMPWSAIPEETYLYIKSFMLGKAIVAPRAWLYAPPLPAGVTSQATGQTWIIFSPQARTRISSFMAFTPEEANISGIDKLLLPGKGRWFIEDDIYSCILPDSLAGNLSLELGRPVDVDSVIRIWGMDLKVVGIIDGDALTSFVDLDNEWITPIDITTTQPTSPPHYTGEMNAIIPYKLYTRMAFPALIMTIAVKPLNLSQTPSLAEEFAYKTAFNIFYGLDGTAFLIRARQWIQVLGAAQIFVPIIIASLTILSLMLGNVTERKGEIQVYNAVGMSPSHITQMFLVESLSYAAPAVIVGYIGGILTSVILIQLGLYPPGLYPNYSSLIILVIMGIDIAMVLSAAIYPALLLSHIAVPSLARRWKVAKPSGDTWNIPLPFVALERETTAFFEFFKEYLMSYSLERYGTFHTLSTSFHSETTTEEETVKRLTARMRLAPYDLGIEQDASIIGVSREGGMYTFTLTVQRFRGYRDQWITSNMPFIDVLRKQWLIWRALPPSEREKYAEKAKTELRS